MQFLEKEPSKFECLNNNEWGSCNKATICSRYPGEIREGVSYRSIKSDPDYLNNWVDKLALLCQPQHKIGFLGSSYFLGIIGAMLVVPTLSDHFGRKNIFCMTMIISIISQYGLLISSSLDYSTLYMIMLGATWPGKRVTGLNYILEFLP